MRIAITKQPAFLSEKSVTSLLAAGTASDVWVEDELVKDNHESHGKRSAVSSSDY